MKSSTGPPRLPICRTSIGSYFDSARATARRRDSSSASCRARRIGDAPLGGRPRDDLAAGLRTIPFERTAVIAYRVLERVEITNVFYGRRDYEALYRPRDEPENEANG